MRRIVVLIAVVGIASSVACTATVDIYKESMLAASCSELGALCRSGIGCAEQHTFCGPLKPDLDKLFIAEDACKSGCADTGCIRQCKAERTLAVDAILRTTDLDRDGVVGDGLNACPNLAQLCSSSPEACPSNEFFCTAAAFGASAAPPDACSIELDQCKASCPRRDRPCRSACRRAYQICLDGPMPDAGVPDAPPPTTTYDLTYGTTAGSTGTGTIARNPLGTSCGTNCAAYAANTTVTLTATPATGSTFGGWTGCTSATNTCSVTLTQALAVTARFTLTPLATYNLTYGTTAGSTGTGTIARNPLGTSCGTNCAAYAANTTVTLTATPAMYSTFTGWSGACTGTGTCTVSMTVNRSVTATFVQSCILAAPLPTPADGRHNAGADCLACHSNAAIVGSSRVWTVAGTLYTTVSGSAPVAQATIEMVDGAGQTVKMATGTNGNFWTTQAVTFPLRVRASKCPSDQAMASTVSSGSCNGCHNSAFRIHLP